MEEEDSPDVQVASVNTQDTVADNQNDASQPDTPDEKESSVAPTQAANGSSAQSPKPKKKHILTKET